MAFFLSPVQGVWIRARYDESDEKKTLFHVRSGRYVLDVTVTGSVLTAKTWCRKALEIRRPRDDSDKVVVAAICEVHAPTIAATELPAPPATEFPAPPPTVLATAVCLGPLPPKVHEMLSYSFVRRILLENIRAVMEIVREEAETVILGVVDDLIAKMRERMEDIGVLVVNCSLFCPTPSLAAMIENRYGLPEDLISYNLSGMGCSAGLISVDLVKHLLQVHPNVAGEALKANITTLGPLVLPIL